MLWFVCVITHSFLIAKAAGRGLRKKGDTTEPNVTCLDLLITFVFSSKASCAYLVTSMTLSLGILQKTYLIFTHSAGFK